MLLLNLKIFWKRLKCVSFDERFAANTYKVKEVCDFKEIPKLNNIKESDNSHESDEYTSNTSEVKKCDDNDSQRGTLNQFVCSVCGKVLKTRSSLMKHVASMHQKRKHIGDVSGFSSTRRYHCTSCSYSTPHSQTLVNHMRRHDGERPYHCQCGKRFTQAASLSAHQKTHSSTTYFTCSVCGKQFKHSYTLKKHSQVHENSKLACNICHKLLKSKQSLQDHMYRHYNIRNYNCEDCGDTFVTSSELLSHRKKHNIEKRVECYFCGYKTHTKKSLILHLKRHMGDKQFKCELCDLSFYTRGDVKRHHRVHTREKPFGCPTCTQKFTYSTSLNKHMLTVHGVLYKWADFKHKDIQKLNKTDDSEDKK
ncbi:zinc finger protein 239-like isoform X2 [Ostrinia furnacalis]|uniref:zinc finger protein 239-like isoform X2 n=1 Tax=Ostrinia furnacalis TaxID=93504 RepID=UPI00103B71C9|nr:zinc finger protein 239-like isoform X2 [Ostrinia furnacalis]